MDSRGAESSPQSGTSALALLLAAGFAVSHGGWSLIELLQSLHAGEALRVVDFTSFHYAADAAFNRGLSPYAADTIALYAGELGHRVYPFLYPPAALPLFYPLSLLGYEAGAAVILAVNALLAGVLFHLIHEMFLMRLGRGGLFAAAMTLALLFDAVRQTIGLGQINLIPAVTLLMAWRLLRRERQPYAAGALIGVAILAKTYFVVYLLLLVLRGQYRALVGAVAAVFAAALLSLPMLPLELWTEWAAMAGARGGFGRLPFPEYPLAAIWNQSVNGVVTRLFGPGAPAGEIGAALAAAIMAASAWRLWSSRDLAGAAFYDSGFVLLSGALYLVAPLSWTHHLVFLLAPAFCLWSRGEIRQSGRAAGIVLCGLSALIAVRWPLPRLFELSPFLASLPFGVVLLFWTFSLSRLALPWKSRQAVYAHAV